jgi:hypothetical protein
MYRNLRESIHDRYLIIFALILLMLSVHVFALPIHPLIFVVWPLSFWLISEIYIRSGWRRFLLYLFLLTSQVIMNQLLVKESPDGIFFNLVSTQNVPVLSYLPITIAGFLFLYDVLRSSSTSFQDITVYIGFSSTIPWLSPAIVEACILVRWYLQGELWAMTAGKGLGGAGLNDILFHYGWMNFIYSSFLFTAGMTVIYLYRGLQRRRVERELERIVKVEDRLWHIEAWDKPSSLLSREEKAAFSVKYEHLSGEQQNEKLRKEVLPAKGIFLIDPRKEA